MKKVLAVLLVLALVVSFAACANNGGGNQEETWKIATVVKDSSDPWFIRMEEGVNKFADDTGIEAFQKGPASCDAALQVQLLKELIAQDIDALCVVPIDPGACEEVLQEARDKGIIVITHEGSTTVNTDYNIEAFDNIGYGAYMMDELAKAMGEEGEYVCMVSYLTNASHNEWADAAIARQKEMYPNMTLIEEDRVETEDNMEVAYERAKELFKKYPNLKGFLGTSSFDAPGAGKAIAELGLIGKSFAVGTSVTSCAEAQLTDGSCAAVTCWDPADAGYAMNVLAQMILEGKEAEIVTGLDLGIEGFDNLTVDGNQINGQGWIVITKDNMSEYQF